MYQISRLDEFSESDLQSFENTIKEWSILFVDLFINYSPSKLCLPKIHSWRYHIIPAIKLYGSINGFTTETFETTHKFFVKNPYRQSNKRNIRPQLLANIQRRSIMDMCNYIKTNIDYPLHEISIFSKKIWQFKLNEMEFFFEKVKLTYQVDEYYIAIEKFRPCLNVFIKSLDGNVTEDDLHDSLAIAETFSYVKLNTGEYVRATHSFYNELWFSDIAIIMDASEHGDYLTDNGICYGKVQCTIY